MSAAESIQRKQQRAQQICERLKKEYPGATTALNWSNPRELLMATILSAQCTDERVNQVTEMLFQKYPTVRDYAQAPIEEMEQDIRPTGFFRNKAKSIRGAARMIEEQFAGQVPDNMENMLKLPGVARKTANVVLGTALGKPTGIAVDTHVKRLAGRMRLSDERNPDKIEQDLLALIPQGDWIDFGHAMIWHGRQICPARKAKCGECCMEDLCPKRGVKEG